MTQNSKIILSYTVVQIKIKKKNSIVQIHKINQNKCRFFFEKFQVDSQHLNVCTMIYFLNLLLSSQITCLNFFYLNFSF